MIQFGPKIRGGGGPLVEESNKMLTTCTIAKLIKIKVLWHQFSNLMLNLNYM